MTFPDLTSAERDVMEGMAEGLTNKAIGKRLFVCERAIEQRCATLYAKLDLTSPSPGWNRRVVAVLKWMEAQRG